MEKLVYIAFSDAIWMYDVWCDESSHVRQLLKHLHDAQGGGGVQPRGRLVQQQNGGVDQNLVPDTHTLPLAPRNAAQELASDDGVATPVQPNSMRLSTMRSAKRQPYVL